MNLDEFFNEQVDKYREFIEFLIPFEKLEYLMIQAPLPASETLKLIADLIFEKQHLKILNIEFNHKFWKDWTPTKKAEENDGGLDLE